MVKIKILDDLKELFNFMRHRKTLWLLPMVIVLLVFGIFLFATQGAVITPFIYALF